MKNVKDFIKNLLVVSGKKVVAGVNLMALVACFVPATISATSKADSEENREKQRRIEKLGYTCEDDDCKTCMAVDCYNMDDFCIKSCEEVLKKYIDPLTCSDKAKEQKLAVMQRTFNTKNR